MVQGRALRAALRRLRHLERPAGGWEGRQSHGRRGRRGADPLPHRAGLRRGG